MFDFYKNKISGLSHILGCEVAYFPFNIHRKLSMWKSKSLSFGGRLTLVKLMLGSIHLFHFSLFKAHGGCEEINKINWVQRKVILASKDQGGLGVGSLKSINISLIFQVDLLDGSSLWCQVIVGIHNLLKKLISNRSQKSLPGVWCNIAMVIHEIDRLYIYASKIITCKVGSGTNCWISV
uniref:Uncharacterized protein n=1 Tax=Lactuca sativa TaxID=4236 RepID=A0A9R1UFW4_LACSA|nr:hypothetical protein LSAT_V11C900458420 [Lactuca sativa]